MQINIKTSAALVRKLTNKLQLGEENHIARIALAYSLAQNATCEANGVFFEEDAKQKEYKDQTLFGKYRRYYLSLICQKYQVSKDDERIRQYIKWHVDHGLHLMSQFFEENKNLSGVEFLLEQIEDGINFLTEDESKFTPVSTIATVKQKSVYLNPIKILIGEYQGEELYFTPNDTSAYGNCHIAIAGQSGAGKSYFARKVLERVVAQSNHEVNFLYLDFKGLSKSDMDNNELKDFFDNTKTQLIDTPNNSFPVNPLSFISLVNEKEQKSGINRFVDIIMDFANLGSKQKLTLKNATKIAFESHEKDGTHPSLKDVLNIVTEMVGDEASTLIEILTQLTEIDLFDEEQRESFLNQNYYFSLSGELGSNVRFTATFLVIYYLYNVFMNMDKVPVEQNHSGLRYILLIDEAHTVFKDKKTHEILEKLLREIRSQGVSVMLVSQGIQEFNQKSFDFSEMCATAFLMQIKDINNWSAVSKFLGADDKKRNKLNRQLESLQPRHAISNIREIDFGEKFSTK